MQTKKLIIKGTQFAELNEAYQNVLIWFFAYPEKEFSLNDLVAALSISKTTANKVVGRLVEEKFLRREVLGRLWRVSCNREHAYNLMRKIPYHLERIYESGLLEAIHKDFPGARAVVLFGSYRKGDDISTSDVDIALELVGDHKPTIVPHGILRQLGYRQNVPVQIHVFSRNRVDLNLFANIANGIVLEGFLEAHP